MNAPNVLVIMPDQHRADAMGCASNPVVKTPNLDSLAADGVRFGRTYCQGPLCMPARASFLTERYVRDHGVFQNEWDVPTDMPTFLHSLQGAGYHTGCIGKMHLYVHGPGSTGGRTRDTRDRAETLHKLGFHEPIEGVGKHAAVNIESEYSDYLKEHGLYETYREWMAYRRYGVGQVEINGRTVDRLPMWHVESTPLPTEAHIDNWIGRRAVQWLENYDGDKPFFQWVGFAGPHDPWDAPKEYVDRYRGADIPLGPMAPPQVPDSGPLRMFIEAFQNYGHSATLTEERVREVRRFYYANITMIDERIGDILGALERTGRMDDTWIIYTSDHGEMLGDHNMLTKMVFYEASVRVPLIIRPPKGMAGRVEDALVEHIDISALIRHIAGGAAVPGGEGISLMGHFDGSEAARREVVHSEDYGFGMFRSERYKLVVYEDDGQPVQLFDMAADPDENRNLIDDPASAPVVSDMMARYVEPFLQIPPRRFGPGLVDRLTTGGGGAG